jgi:hypothetical protein
MRASQCASAAARAVVDVPGTIVAAKQTNAQARARELIIVLVNFVFIVVVSFCLSFLVWPSVALHREELFLAVHRSTERKSARGYDQVVGFFRPEETKLERHAAAGASMSGKRYTS